MMMCAPQKASFAGNAAGLKTRKAQKASVATVTRAELPAEAVSRRNALSVFSAVSAVTVAKPSLAAYGEGANVFGRVTDDTGFRPYAGDGYAILIPSKWNPSKEKVFPGTDIYYEDNFDAVSNMSVLVTSTSKTKVEDFGSPEAFLEKVAFLLGEQAWQGNTRSEGGFAPGKVSTAAVLDVFSKKDKAGKTYYMYEILTRTADGNEGGRHQLVAATVSNGAVYALKIQSGDKRWFKGTDRECKAVWDSFTVA